MKLFRISSLIIVFIFIALGVKAQFKNNVWCFGDSAGVKFDQGATQLFNSSTVTRGGSCTISDSVGNLLFYTNTDYYFLWNQGFVSLGVVWDRNHNLMQNGDTLIGSLLFQEQVIVPLPGSSHLFYIFTPSVLFFYGFWYSVVDLNQNGGLGAVVQKNVQMTNYQASDCVTAVKHGNGRDWWVFFRRFDVVNDSMYRYLITPLGIEGPFVQNIGTPTDNGFMHTTFSKDGSKYLVVNYRGLIEVYDFDRCSGLFSNVTVIESERLPSLVPKYTGNAFSASGRYIYVSTTDNADTYLYQFDLLAPDITASKTLIYSVQTPSYFGYMRLAPDNKIYCSLNYYDGINTYPYTDSLNNNFNQNMSVINYPDSAGTACGFSPFSFYLGGNETYWGMPNNPEYDLPALAGSPCDTLVSQNELAGAEGSLQVYYHPAWEKAFINASHLKGKIGNLLVYDLQGKVIHSEPLRIQNGYYTRDLSMAGNAKGMYLVAIQTEKEQLTKKLMVE
ncbi:MAG: T9SS type A sorting domain-containing protein [Bacteroidetes bacterium]|nr:T9SS type A sorting domain-containing protein [Bacteroidota bacterium]